MFAAFLGIYSLFRIFRIFPSFREYTKECMFIGNNVVFTGISTDIPSFHVYLG